MPLTCPTKFPETRQRKRTHPKHERNHNHHNNTHHREPTPSRRIVLQGKPSYLGMATIQTSTASKPWQRPSFDNTFIREEVLGEGAHAIIFRATHRKNHKTYAVKDVANGYSEELEHEMQILLHLTGSPHIVQLYNVFHEEETRHTYLVMEEMRGGDLLTRIIERGRYTEPDARQVCRNLLEAVDYCHKLKVAHRDLKPDNLLLVEKDNDVKIKLSDFGLAAFVDQPNCLRTLCGTTEYAAPEVFAGNGYDQRADMWSVGVILFILLSGYEPFEGPLEQVLAAIQYGVYSFDDECWDTVSESAKSLIRSMLNIDPWHRITAREALASEWMDVPERRLSMQELRLKFDRRRNDTSESLLIRGEANVMHNLSDSSDGSQQRVSTRFPATK